VRSPSWLAGAAAPGAWCIFFDNTALGGATTDAPGPLERLAPGVA
jgi:hypothetical protein